MDVMEESAAVQFAKVLADKQQSRFEELSCQLAGPMVLRLIRYALRLQLSKGQVTSVRDLVDSYCEKAAPPHRAGFVVRSPDAERQLKILAGELDNKILGILTEKQRAKWTSLLGKGFDWAGLAK